MEEEPRADYGIIFSKYGVLNVKCGLLETQKEYAEQRARLINEGCQIEYSTCPMSDAQFAIFSELNRKRKLTRSTLTQIIAELEVAGEEKW